MTKLAKLKTANKLLKVDEEKLTPFFLYYNNELLAEPDPEFPNLPVMTATQRDKFTKLRKVFSLFDIGRTEPMIRSMLMKECDLEERQARNIIQEAYILYGVIGKADDEGKKRASINYYRTLSNLAFKKGNEEAAGKLNLIADKLEGLFDEAKSALNPEDFRHPSQFVFINDLKVYKNRTKELDPDE